MISRQWSALCPKEKADAYIEHLLSETFQILKTIKGFRKASILTREEKEAVQFLIITEWNSVGDIKAFAGEEVEQAVVPDKVKQMMIQYDDKARHFEIRDEVIA